MFVTPSDTTTYPKRANTYDTFAFKHLKGNQRKVDWKALLRLDKFFGKTHPHTQEKARRVRQMEHLRAE